MSEKPWISGVMDSAIEVTGTTDETAGYILKRRRNMKL
jgi:hypothetical protein